MHRHDYYKQEGDTVPITLGQHKSTLLSGLSPLILCALFLSSIFCLKEYNSCTWHSYCVPSMVSWAFCDPPFSVRPFIFPVFLLLVGPRLIWRALCGSVGASHDWHGLLEALFVKVFGCRKLTQVDIPCPKFFLSGPCFHLAIKLWRQLFFGISLGYYLLKKKKLFGFIMVDFVSLIF